LEVLSGLRWHQARIHLRLDVLRTCEASVDSGVPRGTTRPVRAAVDPGARQNHPVVIPATCGERASRWPPEGRELPRKSWTYDITQGRILRNQNTESSSAEVRNPNFWF
jgi:hypothetical protein